MGIFGHVLILVCFWRKNFVFLEIFVNKVEIYNSDYTRLNHAYILIFFNLSKAGLM